MYANLSNYASRELVEEEEVEIVEVEIVEAAEKVEDAEMIVRVMCSPLTMMAPKKKHFLTLAVQMTDGKNWGISPSIPTRLT